MSTSLSKTRILLLFISTFSFIVCSLLLAPSFQNALFGLAERARHPLDRLLWQKRFHDWMRPDRIIAAAVFVATLFYAQLSQAAQKLLLSLEKDEKREKLFLAANLAVYGVLNFVTVFFHEHWADEAQAWMIAKTLSPAGLLSVTPFEGHPVLWYLLIMPFAKLGLPYDALSFINFALTFCAAFIFVKNAEINTLLKVAVLFSPCFNYYSSVIARSYCIFHLELACFAVFYKKRNARPLLWGILVACMFQTHVFLAGLAGMLTMQMAYDFFREKERKRKGAVLGGFLLAVASALLMLFELVDRNSLSTQRSGIERVLETLLSPQIASTAKAHMNVMEMALGSEILGSLLVACFFVSLLPVLWKGRKRVWQELLVALGAAGTLVFISFVFRPCTLNHSSAYFALYSALLYVLFAAKNAETGFEGLKLNKTARYSGLAVLVLAAAFTLHRVCFDLIHPFSNAKEAAAYMNENFGENDVFVMEYDSCAIQAIVPYLKPGLEIIYADDDSVLSFVNYGSGFPKSGDIREWQNRTGKNAYFIVPGAPLADGNFSLVYSLGGETLYDGPYYFYKSS